MGHLIFFVFGRFYLDGELNLAMGRRVWKTDFPLANPPQPSTAGSKDVDAEYIRYLLDHKKIQMKMMMTFCARCSNCAESCFLYANSGDPAYIPSHKVFHSIGKLYRRKGRVSRRELEEMGDAVWNKCVLCERRYCPGALRSRI
jgi:ferredoxin